MESISKKTNYLIMCASGGGGILQAANAEVQKIKIKDPSANIIKKDVMLQWLGPIGYFGMKSWNFSQKRGIILFLQILGGFQRIAEIIFWPYFFYHVLKTLFKENIDYIVDLQPLCSSATIKAIRLYNHIRKKNVTIKKVVVDLPTKKAVHYFNNIKKLSKKDKNLLSITTIDPLLDKDQTDIEFWKKFCDISLDKICYHDYPLRQSFLSYDKKAKIFSDFFINIAIKSELEAKFITKTINKGSIKIKTQDLKFLEFQIERNDFLITILLGSQPSLNATFNYVKNIIKMIKEEKVERKIHIFTFCSSTKEGLFKKLFDFLEDFEDYPKNLSIVPMSFQTEEVIASLFFRSDMTITRSGGQTAVELMKVCNGKICVHSEYPYKKNTKLTDKKLLKGIPVWEAGSASYMQEKMNASLIIPELFSEICSKLILD